MVSLIRAEAERVMREALVRVFHASGELLESWVAQVAYPSDSPLAHVAFPCHALARNLKMSPQAIASLLSADLQNARGKSLVKEARAVGGYLNFSVDVDALFSLLEHRQSVGSEQRDESPAKVDVEFSQPNTHKFLHVGHLRNMIYGEAVCNLLQAAGTNVIRSTFPGDMGAHVAKCLWYIKKYQGQTIPAVPDVHWLGRMYCDSDAFLKGLTGTMEEQAARDEIGVVLRDLEAHEGPLYPLYQETRRWSLDAMEETYRWLGIRFDRWYFESECDVESRRLVLEKYQEGFFRKSQGAIGLDLGEYDLGFVIFLKSDGAGLYITKDLELLKQKFSDPEVESSIVVVDSRQKLHFKQLFKTAELMGYPQAKRSLHLSYEAVTDEQGAAFSSRDRNGIHLDELRQRMHDRVFQDYLVQYRGQWSEEEIQATADQIVLGALKYGFLKYDAGKIIKFVLDEWIQMEGNTGPYLQYTFARCCSLLGKVERVPVETTPVLETELEQDLVLFLEQFPETIRQAATSHRPSVACSYLFDLAKAFNRVYKECPIRTASNPAVRNTRLGLVALVARTLREGLGLLGIPCPERL